MENSFSVVGKPLVHTKMHKEREPVQGLKQKWRTGPSTEPCGWAGHSERWCSAIALPRLPLSQEKPGNGSALPMPSDGGRF